jgi:hypothetical protein
MIQMQVTFGGLLRIIPRSMDNFTNVHATTGIACPQPPPRAALSFTPVLRTATADREPDLATDPFNTLDRTSSPDSTFL